MLTKKFSIRFTIVSLFILLSLIIIAMMLFMQLSFSEHLAKKAANEQFNLLAKKVINNINRTHKQNNGLINIFASILKNQTEFKKRKNIIEIYTSFLKQNENLSNIYIGTKNDLFFAVINPLVNKSAQKKYKAKKGDRWLVLEMAENTNTQKQTLLDKNLQPTSSIEVSSSYRASQRPWFKIATGINNKATKTEPYNFINVSGRGITYAKEFKDGIVCSIDLLLKNLDDLLILADFNKQINSVILDKNLKIVAQSTPDNIKNIINEMKKSINFQVDKEASKNGLLEIKDTRYIYHIEKLDTDILVSFSDLSTFIKPYRDQFKTMTILTIGILALLFPLIWYFASIIVKPIKKLSRENKKIEQLQFDNIKEVSSHISEISYLSESFISMANAIKNSQRNLEQKVNERTMELKKLSETDKLTGLLNRMKIDKCIEDEIKRQNRYSQHFGLIFIDIDHFKSINDTYGHQVGDNVLKEFAMILKNNARKTDSIGRWGGEEFIIVCLETTQEGLIKTANKLQEIIEEHNFKTIGKKTASFGITISKNDERLETLVNRADEALYLAKKRGRNRVEAIF